MWKLAPLAEGFQLANKLCSKISWLVNNLPS